MAPWEDYLKSIYYEPSHPASFSGPQKLYKVVQNEGKFDIGMHRIRKFLHNQESYSLHKPVRRRFQRNSIVTAGKDDLWMADLIDMVKFEKWNDGFKYILLVVDTFSKYVWLRPLKNKTGEAVAKAFKDIFKEYGRAPAKLITDKGQEFRAKRVQSLMTDNDVRYFPTQNSDTKASISERSIKTIKTKLYRFFTNKDNYSYLPVLQDVANSYNRTYHRTIGMAPSDVKKANSEEVRLSTYFSRTQRTKGDLKRFKYKIGDYVRISHLTSKFTREYDQKYSGEVFKVYKRYHRGSLPIYRLRDLQDENIEGTFYEAELQRIDLDPDQTWKVEKVLKTRGKGRNKQLFVKWQYYPKKFNSWINTNDIE